MPERLKDFIPFMVGGIVAVPGAKVNINRIIEAIIIAAVTGGIAMYGTAEVLKTQMGNIQARQTEIANDITQSLVLIRNDIRDAKQDNVDTRKILIDHMMSDRDQFKRVQR